MADMPRLVVSKSKRIADYALGIIHESLWILGTTLLAFVMAVIAMAVYR